MLPEYTASITLRLETITPPANHLRGSGIDVMRMAFGSCAELVEVKISHSKYMPQ